MEVRSPSDTYHILYKHDTSKVSTTLLTYYSMTVKLLTEHHLEFLNLKGGCTGSSESTLVKMSRCSISNVSQLI